MKKRVKRFFLPNRLFYICTINKKQIDMENTDLDQLTKSLDELYDQQSRKLYAHIMEMGLDAFRKDSALYKYKDTDLLEKLITYFESVEEYEKCSDLQKVTWLLNGIVD